MTKREFTAVYVYGKGWQYSPNEPNTDEVFSITAECVTDLVEGKGGSVKLYKRTALMQVVGAFLEEFRGKGPFPLSIANPKLAALVVTRKTFQETVQWHNTHPQYEESLNQLKSIEHYWKFRKS